MKEPKSTQGPWEVSKILLADYKSIAIVSEEKNKVILHLNLNTKSILEDEANAHLISQAPELFKLLQETITCLDKYCIPETSDELTSIVSRSKEVIRKSLGE